MHCMQVSQQFPRIKFHDFSILQEIQAGVPCLPPPYGRGLKEDKRQGWWGSTQCQYTALYTFESISGHVGSIIYANLKKCNLTWKWAHLPKITNFITLYASCNGRQYQKGVRPFKINCVVWVTSLVPFATIIQKTHTNQKSHFYLPPSYLLEKIPDSNHTIYFERPYAHVTKQQYFLRYELFSPIFGQKAMHMSPPCNLHRWAQNVNWPCDYMHRLQTDYRHTNTLDW